MNKDRSPEPARGIPAEPSTKPKVTTTKRVTFSMLQIVEAMNTAYPDLKIDFANVRARQGGEMGSPVSSVEFEWDQK
jgi:hypothetical protein